MFDANGAPGIPVTRALLRERGVKFHKDRRGINVVSAYAPIKDFGLGLAVKTDADSLYAPMRARLNLPCGPRGLRSQRPVISQVRPCQQPVRRAPDQAPSGDQTEPFAWPGRR
jgi:hypothetical protein